MWEKVHDLCPTACPTHIIVDVEIASINAFVQYFLQRSEAVFFHYIGQDEALGSTPLNNFETKDYPENNFARLLKIYKRQSLSREQCIFNLSTQICISCLRSYSIRIVSN